MRLKGEGSISKDKKNNNFKVRITVEGKRITKIAKDDKKATKILNELKRKYGMVKFSDKMTLGAFYLEWLYNIKYFQVSARTFQKYLNIYENHLEPYSLSKMEISSITKYDVTKFLNMLCVKGYSRQQLQEIKKHLSSCFNAADEFVTKNPCTNVQIPQRAKDNKRDYGKYNAFTKDEQVKVIEYLKTNQSEFMDRVYNTAFILMLGTGLRAGELKALNYIRDFNKDYTELEVRYNLQYSPIYDTEKRELSKYEYTLKEPKTASSVRKIPLGKDLSKYIKKYVMFLKEHSLKEEYFINQHLLFPNEIGGYLPKNTMRRKLEYITRKLKLNRVNVHGLRHSFATRLLENGVQMEVISKLLGHSTVSMTQDVYAHVLDELKENSMEKVGNFLGL